MKSLWIIVGVVVALLATAFIAWSVGGSRALESAIDEVDTVHRVKALEGDYPEREDSTDAAWRVDDVARRMGLHVIPLAGSGLRGTVDTTEWNAVGGDVSDYVSALRSGTSDTPPAIPASVAAFLETHDADLDELEGLLLGSEEIRFASNIELGPSSPLPNLLGQVSLTKVLAARSMAANARGDSEAAWRSLEAIRRLTLTLSDQPALICKLISVADQKILMAAARRLEPPVPGWFRAIEVSGPRREIDEGLRGEMYFMARLSERSVLDDWSPSGTSDKIDVVRNPILRAMYHWDAAYSLRDLNGLTKVARETDPCAFDPNSGAPTGRPWWATGSMSMPNLASTFTRASQAALDIEGTNAILDLKENPSAFTKRASSVCAGQSWVAETAEDGSIHVRFTGRIIPPENQPEGSELAKEHWIQK